jgi:putative holliday junction resolvase
MTRLLGIDHGLARIGLAVSDAGRMVARELMIIKRTSNKEDFARIHRVASEQNVVGVVVGVPFDPDNEERGRRTQADTVKNWVERFSQTTSLPIVLWDENLTSVDAQEIARRQRRKLREPIDDLAARVMLQSYLDAAREGLAPTFPLEERNS